MESQPILPHVQPPKGMLTKTFSVSTPQLVGMDDRRLGGYDSLARSTSLQDSAALPTPSNEIKGWKDVDVFASFRSPMTVYHVHDDGTSDTSFRIPLSAKLSGQSGPNATCAKLWRFVAVPTLLCMVGLASTAVATLVNFFISYAAAEFRRPLTELYPRWEGWLAYMVYSVLMALASTLVVQAFCPDACGGGIPDMKTVLSGVTKESVLSFRMLLAKMIGLPLAAAAGLSVGREGPFVHMSCCLANLFMRLPCFEHIRLNEAKRIDILACACAAGVAATFGTPFGAVLFSIEVTAVCYMVGNVPQAFFCAMCGSVLITLLGLSDMMNLFSENIATAKGYTQCDLIFFAFLGLIAGLLGVVFVVLVNLISHHRNRLLRPELGGATVRQRQFLCVAVVTLVLSPFIYFDNSHGLHGDHRTIAAYLFQSDVIGLPLKLRLFVPYKILVTALSVTLPLPVGLFTPVFITGGAIGRVFGEFVAMMAPAHTKLLPWEFAVIGAAAFSTGVTRAVSTAVILFELSGENHLRLPVGISILVAYFIANRFTKNVYDALINTNGTPHLPVLPSTEYFRLAREVMIPVRTMPYLTLDSTYKDAKLLLRRHRLSNIPVVSTESCMTLVGCVRRSDLKRAVNVLQHMIEVATSSPIMLGPPGGLSLFDYDSESSCVSENEVPGVAFPGLAMLPFSTSREAHNGNSGRTSPQRAGRPPSGNSPRASFNSSASSDFFQDEIAATENGNGEGGGGVEALNALPGHDWNKAVQYVVYNNHSQPVPVRSRRESRSVSYSPVLSVPLDTSPYQLIDTMHLSKVDLVFRMLKVDHAYVTKAGRLIGVITRQRMREHLGAKEKFPIDSCIDMCCPGSLPR